MIRIASLLAVLALPGTAKAAHSLEIRGTGAMAPLARALAERYMHEHKDSIITVEPCASEQGLKSLIIGTAGLAMATDEVPEEIAAFAAAKQIELKKTDVYRDAIAVVAHANHPVRKLTMRQLRDVFRGAVTNWNQVGGPDLPVKVLSPNPTNSAYEVFKARVLGGQAVITPKAEMFEHEGLKDVLKPGAIAYVALAMVEHLGLEVVAINGVLPSHDTVKSGHYPIVRHMSIYQRLPVEPLSDELVKYFIAPDIGQKLVVESGKIPVKQ